MQDQNKWRSKGQNNELRFFSKCSRKQIEVVKQISEKKLIDFHKDNSNKCISSQVCKGGTNEEGLKGRN